MRFMLNCQRFRRGLGLWSAAAALGLSAIVGYADNASAQQLKKVSIRTDWFADGQHAGYYIANAKGYYKAAGLDVTILSGSGSIQVVQQVAAGNDTFGNAFGLAVIGGRANGAPVKAVANFGADAMACIAIRADSGMTSPKDLKGKTVGSGTGSPFAAFLPIIWKNVGLSDTDVTVQQIAPSSGVPDLVNKRIAGWLGASWEEPIVMEMDFKTKGGCFLFKDYGAGFLGPSIITNDKTIASDPAMVKAFVAASMEGWRYAFAHPAEAGEIVTAANKGVQGADPADAIAAAQPLMKVGIPDPSTKGMAWGSMTAAEWQDTTDKMVTYLGLKNPVKVEELFTNQFVPAGPPP
jgi:NitT/TauT family transport system substrate-binding protein